MRIKNIITPIQAWLLSQGRCTSCGQLLEGARRQRKDEVFLAICICQREFIYNPAVGKYYRAPIQTAFPDGKEGIKVSRSPPCLTG